MPNKEQLMININESLLNSCINKVNDNGYCLLKCQDTSLQLIESALSEYLRHTDKTAYPSASGFTYEKLADSTFTKFCIGAKNNRKDSIPQLLKTTYLPHRQAILKDKLPAIYTLNKTLTLLRNRLCNLPDEFGQNGEADRFWNASRIHHYPTGGGFMAQHRDSAFPKILSNSKIPFLQVSISLSMRGRDYINGGGYIQNKKGETIYTDRSIESPASITIFDGQIKHGVEDIDPNNCFAFSDSNHRIAIFASLYPFIW